MKYLSRQEIEELIKEIKEVEAEIDGAICSLKRIAPKDILQEVKEYLEQKVKKLKDEGKIEKSKLWDKDDRWGK